MALPTSRNTTYAAGSQVKSADLNDVQDKIIDLHEGKHGEITRWLPLPGIETGSGATPEDNVRLNTNPRYIYLVGGNNARLTIWLPLAEGERLKAVHFHLYDNDASATIAGQVHSHGAHTDGAAPPADASLGSVSTDPGASSNLQIRSVTGLSAVADAETSLSASLVMNGSPDADDDLRCYGIRYTTDLP